MSVSLGPLSGAATPSFPLRVGAIDIGSNAIRFLAAEFEARESFRILASVRAPVRMGREAFRARHIHDDVMDAAVEALRGFAAQMRELEVVGYRAVATSAVRDSENGDEFVDRVWRECEIRIETITGTEEAHLVWLAVRHQIPLDERRWVLVDLGGGSVEVSLVDRDEIHWSESHPLGTVRLLEEMGDISAEPPERVRRRLEDHAAMLRISALARRVDAAGMIATGGNIEELAALAAARPDDRGVSRLWLTALDPVMERLGELSPRERVRQLGLREDRADVILPAAVVYERIARLVGAHQIVVPGVGVKEGLLHDVVEDIIEHGGHEARLDREVAAGALATGRRFQFDEPHARQVARLSLELFDQLRELHGLGAPERRILAAAALLHDVGQFVAYRKHHKHSFYLISNLELAGFTPRQIGMVALVARYHRRAEPKEAHEGYGELPREERDVVDRLAALIRIGDALDREHRQQVSALTARVDRKEEELLLEIDGTGDLLPERWAVQRKAEWFEEVFGLEVRFQLLQEAAR